MADTKLNLNGTNNPLTGDNLSFVGTSSLNSNKLILTHALTVVTSGYGLLYNRYAVDTGNLAPTGWRVPTAADLSTLVTNVSRDPSTAGGILKETGYTHWNSPNSGATDGYNFSLRGTGYRDEDGQFASLKTFLFLMVQSGMAYRTFAYDSSAAQLNEGNNNEGNPVRCVRDTDPGSSSITDYDGNSYTVLHIGSQYWTGQNLKTKHYNDGTSIPEVIIDASWVGLSSGALCAYNNDWSNV